MYIYCAEGVHQGQQKFNGRGKCMEQKIHPAPLESPPCLVGKTKIIGIYSKKYHPASPPAIKNPADATSIHIPTFGFLSSVWNSIFGLTGTATLRKSINLFKKYSNANCECSGYNTPNGNTANTLKKIRPQKKNIPFIEFSQNVTLSTCIIKGKFCK